MSPGRPLVVPVTDLLRHPGERRELRRTVPLDDCAISTAAVPSGAEVELDLVLEALSTGLTVTGDVRAPWVGECRRCLGEVTGVAETHVQEVFERHPTEGETYPLADDHVDLEPMVRDAVLLALPLAPLCSEDCLGPAPDAFPATVEADEPAAPAEPDAEADASIGGDPRWAALDALTFDDDAADR